MKVVRYLATPRLNSFDAFLLGLAYGFAPSWGWWVVPFVLAGLFVSAAIEVAVQP